MRFSQRGMRCRIRLQTAREAHAIHRTIIIRQTIIARPHAWNGEPALLKVASPAEIPAVLVEEAIRRIRCRACPVQETLRQVLVLTEFIAPGSWWRCCGHSTVLIEGWALQEVVPIGDTATICPKAGDHEAVVNHVSTLTGALVAVVHTATRLRRQPAQTIARNGTKCGCWRRLHWCRSGRGRRSWCWR